MIRWAVIWRIGQATRTRRKVDPEALRVEVRTMAKRVGEVRNQEGMCNCVAVFLIAYKNIKRHT